MTWFGVDIIKENVYKIRENVSFDYFFCDYFVYNRGHVILERKR